MNDVKVQIFFCSYNNEILCVYVNPVKKEYFFDSIIYYLCDWRNKFEKENKIFFFTL